MRIKVIGDARAVADGYIVPVVIDQGVPIHADLTVDSAADATAIEAAVGRIAPDAVPGPAEGSIQ